ncbi:hypothetical protein pdam_00002501 [Pocillopora damicornis]|uniref:Apple domain-containing protein n=1 Tax=Pocillopora damicornis TaxID=46731 RepID=A0A3M6TRX2_POCDA|nr:hypothetical protein pdam_00002501 [Pocillopora damicornis]
MTCGGRCVGSLSLVGLLMAIAVSADAQCRQETSIGSSHECDICCERKTRCQSYNYVIGEKFCELNNRTKEANPVNFLADSRFYQVGIFGRASLGSIPELPAVSCQEIIASESKAVISKQYWLDLGGSEKAVLVYCDMGMEDIDESPNIWNLYKAGKTIGGVYTIKPEKRSALDVLCDQKIAGGGWTGILKETGQLG